MAREFDRWAHFMTFQTTRWSLILAGRNEGVAARDALEWLCTAYRRPVLAYVRSRGYSRTDAEDLTQAFFTALIERRIDHVADPNRGRFRSLMLASLHHFLSNNAAQARTARRSPNGTPVDWEDVEHITSGGDLSPEQAFERAWALTVLDRAMSTLEQEAQQAGKGALFARLREFLVEQPDAEEYVRLAAELDMRQNTVAVAIHRLRQRLRERIRGELAQTVDSRGAIEDEVRALRHVLAGV